MAIFINNKKDTLHYEQKYNKYIMCIHKKSIVYSFNICKILCGHIELVIHGIGIHQHLLIDNYLTNKFKDVDELKLYNNNFNIINIYNKYYFNDNVNIKEYQMVYNYRFCGCSYYAIKNILKCKNYKSSIFIICN